MTFGSRCREDLKDLFLTEHELLERNTHNEYVYIMGEASVTGMGVVCFPTQASITFSGTNRLYAAAWGNKTVYFQQRGSSIVLSSCTVNETNNFQLCAIGCNRCGVLGNLSTANSASAVKVCGDTNIGWSCISPGVLHTLGVRRDGSLWAWGDGTCYSLGDGNNLSQCTPHLIQSSGWKSVGAGDWSSFAIDQSDNLYAWGRNTCGLLGLGVSTTTIINPTCVGSGYKQACIGNQFAVFLKKDGTLWTAGNNCAGKLGVNNANTTTVLQYNVSSPVQITSPSRVWKCIAVGKDQAAAITTTGELWFWGMNEHCNSGLPGLTSGTGVGASCPVQIGTHYKKVVLSQFGGAGIRVDGRLYTWGSQTAAAPWLGVGNCVTCVQPSPCNRVGYYQSVTDVALAERRLYFTAEDSYGVT